MDRLVLTEFYKCKWPNAWVCEITDPQLDQTIHNIAGEQNMSLEQFRAQVVQEKAVMKHSVSVYGKKSPLVK